MPQNPHERWRPPNVYYADLVARATALDPKAVVSGAASTAEIARMEKLVDRLEKQAAEKAAAGRQNDPHNIASAGIRTLWSRGLVAREFIRKMQEEKLGRKYSSSDTIYWHPEMQALNPPAEFFEPVPDIGRGEPPRFSTLEEADTLATALGVTVTTLEALASKMSRFLQGWEDLSFEQQTRRLVMTLFAAGKAGG